MVNSDDNVQVTTDPLIEISGLLPRWMNNPLGRMMTRGLNRFLALDKVNETYDSLRSRTSPNDNFFIRALQTLDISYEVSAEDLGRIPTEGPLVVVANHPYGGLDGIILGALLANVRPDYKVLANSVLQQMVEIKPWLIPVNPFGGPTAARENLAGMKECMRLLKEGGCVGTFPGGMVSHLRLRLGQVSDPKWNLHVTRLVRRSGATVVPVYFEGRNSNFFQLMGLLHPILRTVLLPRELMRRCHKSVRLRVGRAIGPKRLAEFGSEEEMSNFLRLSAYILRDRASQSSGGSRRFPIRRSTGVQGSNGKSALATPMPADLLEDEIARLDAAALLVGHGDLSVYIARSDDIPNLLQEIGRLREKTFREVGEGTGQSRDLDEFDVYYRHLFMWDQKAKAVVGAYRMGLTDEILEEYGRKGLYTSTLFRYKPGFLSQLSPAIELGRSFIVSEYQRKHASLALIWRGIGRFLVLNPRYQRLFGPVSISHEYTRISKDLMVQFLKRNNYDVALASLVRAKHPPRRGRIRPSERRSLASSVRKVDDISALVSEVEKDQKGIPILLRHYLKMNGRILAFNVDYSFGQCLDGLIVVDLLKSDRRLLKAYLTEEGLQSFLDFHANREEEWQSAIG